MRQRVVSRAREIEQDEVSAIGHGLAAVGGDA